MLLATERWGKGHTSRITVHITITHGQDSKARKCSRLLYHKCHQFLAHLDDASICTVVARDPERTFLVVMFIFGGAGDLCTIFQAGCSPLVKHKNMTLYFEDNPCMRFNATFFYNRVKLHMFLVTTMPLFFLREKLSILLYVAK